MHVLHTVQNGLITKPALSIDFLTLVKWHVQFVLNRLILYTLDSFLSRDWFCSASLFVSDGDIEHF